MTVLFSSVLFAVAVASAPSPSSVCPAQDIACQRRAFAAAGGTGIPADCPDVPVALKEGSAVKDAAQPPAARVPCVRTAGTAKATTGLPWWAVGGAQWATTLAMDLLPAALFGVAAVLVLLPAGSIPAALVLALAVASIPGLPLVQGTTTNLVGDLMSRGTRRGRLLLQLATSMGVLGVQLAVGAAGLSLAGVVVNLLAMQLTVPQAKYLPSQCSDPVGQQQRCLDQVAKTSQASTLPFLAGAGGVLAVVGVNLALAVALKGPLLAASWWLHADAPLPEPYPALAPRLVQHHNHHDAPVELARSAQSNPAG